MTSGANAISYGLYQDAAFSKPWGDGAASGGTLFNGLGLGGIDVPIYGCCFNSSTGINEVRQIGTYRVAGMQCGTSPCGGSGSGSGYTP